MSGFGLAFSTCRGDCRGGGAMNNRYNLENRVIKLEHAIRPADGPRPRMYVSRSLPPRKRQGSSRPASSYRISANFSTRHCSLRPTPHTTKCRQAAACPRAAQKTQARRILRFRLVAALVPSASTNRVAFGCPCPQATARLPVHARRRTYFSPKGESRGAHKARHPRTPPLGTLQRSADGNGSAPAQL